MSYGTAAVLASAGAANGGVAGKSEATREPKSHALPASMGPRPTDERSGSPSGSPELCEKAIGDPDVVTTSGPTETVGKALRTGFA